MKRTIREAITLVEVLVVIGIIALLSSMILPAIQHARAAAEKLSCKSNLRQLGLAMQNCQASYGTFYRTMPDATPESRLSWLVRLLPELEQESTYANSIQACNITTDTRKNPPHVGFAKVLPILICPTDSRLYLPLTDPFGTTVAFTSYVGIIGVMVQGSKETGNKDKYLLGVFGMSKPSLPLIVDGTSYTVMVSERPPPDPATAGWWYPAIDEDSKCRGPHNKIFLGPLITSLPSTPCDNCVRTYTRLGPGRLNNSCDRFHLWSLHGGGANMLFADGSVRFLKYEADSIMPALISVNGREVVEIPD